MDTQSLYQKTILFATQKHVDKNQTVPGTNLPYVVHLSNVAMEVIMACFHTENFDLDYAVQVALLHDTLEDTSTEFEEIEDKLSLKVAKGVSALTKNSDLPKDEQMPDTLERIKDQPLEIWAIKLADRNTNLQAPPLDWSKEKKEEYYKESKTILRELQEGNAFLAKRLEMKIREY
ncbi:MAG TPA: HD domain-containing protein, partial [Prolixibacteraceae bacterium]|nr:HD domain-containing protein [Prolixibacteraceae bacterium]